MKEMKSEASPGLYKDILAGNKSILRKVFGISLDQFSVTVFCFSVLLAH